MKMMREEPLFKKCCFFIPLRFCLQTWACIKLVVDGLAISYLIISAAVLYGLYGYNTDWVFGAIAVFYFMSLIIIALFADVAFLILLIAGIFKKSMEVLRIFFFYEIYAMTAEAAVITFVCVNVFEVHTSLGFLYAFIGVVYVLMDLCICLTVHSEIIKLRNKEQYDFSRMLTEDEGNGKFRVEEEC